MWHQGTLTLRAERQSALMSQITNDGWTRSGTGRIAFAIPTWQHWASKGWQGKRRYFITVEWCRLLIGGQAAEMHGGSCLVDWLSVWHHAELTSQLCNDTAERQTPILRTRWAAWRRAAVPEHRRCHSEVPWCGRQVLTSCGGTAVTKSTPQELDGCGWCSLSSTRSHKSFHCTAHSGAMWDALFGILL